MEYEKKLNLLNVKELKAFIKGYNLQTKIVMAKKKKEELIVEILKHTDFQNGKVIVKSLPIEGNVEAKPKIVKQKVVKEKVVKEKKEVMKVEPKKEVMKEESLEDKMKNLGLAIKKVNDDLLKNDNKYNPLILERMKEVVKERQSKGEKMNQGKVNRIRDNIIKKEFKEFSDKIDSLFEIGEKLKKEVQTILDDMKVKDMPRAKELLSIYQKYVK